MNGVTLISKEVDNGSENMQNFKKKTIEKCGITGVVFRKNQQLRLLCQFIYVKNIGKLPNF